MLSVFLAGVAGLFLGWLSMLIFVAFVMSSTEAKENG